jgi:5-methylthioadenosine/S-adenosylhomocysteine deaminase
VDLGESVLLPGLVNVHAHPELGFFRGALEDMSFRDWILRLVGAKRAALQDQDYAIAARWSCVEMLRAGITTVGATEASGAALGALLEAGMRGVVYLEALAPDPCHADAALATLQQAVAEMRARETDRVRVGVSPHAPFTVSDPLFASVAEYALAENLPVAIHAAESRAERELVTGGAGAFAPGLQARGIPTPIRGRSTVAMLERLGVLHARPMLIHCVDVDSEDIRLMAERGCTVAHCPIANAKLGHGIAPYGALRAAGIPVGLGTDGVGSNNRLDLLEEARVASLLQRAVHRAPERLPADELLRLCTVEGARALGLEDRIGTLEPGKQADLCAVSLAAPHVRPVHDPVAALFHSARGTDVVMTVVAGREVYRDGVVRTLDGATLARGVEESAERLRGALA